MMSWWVDAILKVLPIYFANASPVAFSKFNFFGLRRPIDNGRVAWDGNRWLGDGKTWQGLIVATIVGGLTGYFLGFYGYGSLLLGLWMGFSAIVGDMVGSFIKRRKGMGRGENAGLLDSLDFITVGIILTYPFVRWSFREVVFLLVLTPVVHRTSNIIGYKLGLKKEPW